MKKHYHVAVGPPGSNTIFQEAQYDDVQESVTAFLKLGQALHGDAVNHNPVMAEAALVTYSKTSDENIMVMVDNDTPFRVYWSMCEGCAQLSWRN